MKKIKELFKKIGTWIYTYLPMIVRIAVISVILYIAITFATVSKFSLALVCVVLSILIYKFFKK